MKKGIIAFANKKKWDVCNKKFQDYYIKDQLSAKLLFILYLKPFRDIVLPEEEKKKDSLQEMIDKLKIIDIPEDIKEYYEEGIKELESKEISKAQGTF